MQITETATEGLTRRFQITIGAADMDERLKRRYSELAKTVNLPGFRPGKVPVSIVRQRFGKSVLAEVVQETVETASADTMEQQKLRPALQPRIELKTFGEGEDLVVDLEVEVLPEITLPDAASLQLERLVAEISEEEVDQAVADLSQRFRKVEPAPEGTAAETGDTVVVDFIGTVDGVAFEGGAAEAKPIELGSGSLIPGFEEQLVGAKAGDHVSIQVTFPTEYPVADLAGKAAVFEADVKEVRRKEPALEGDALAERIGFDDLAELRTMLRERMGRDYGDVARQRMKRDLLDKLAEAHDFAVPAGMVQIEFDSIWRQFEAERDRAKAAGTYEPEEGETDESSKAEYRAIAERRVRLGLLLAELGKSANIQVTQDEVQRAMMAEARRYPGQEKQVFEYYRSQPDAMQSLRAPIYEDKVIDHIFATAQVTERVLPVKEFIEASRIDDDDEEAGV
jgi:trigger factor